MLPDSSQPVADLGHHGQFVEPARASRFTVADAPAYAGEHVRPPIGVGLDGLTAFRWRGRPSPFRGAATPSRTINPMALTLSKPGVGGGVDKVCGEGQ